MTTHMAIQILLTVFVTGACTILATSFVTVANDHVKLQKWFMWTARLSFLIHLIAIPAVIINLIWSF